MTAPSSVDLTNCDREPIHIPGRIQPHGVLVALSEPELRILQISANTAAYTGLPPDAYLGQPLTALVSDDHDAYLRTTLAVEDVEQNPLYLWTVRLLGAETAFDGLIHRHNGVLLLELEPVLPAAGPAPDFYRLVRGMVGRIQQTDSLQGFFDLTAREVRGLTGFDRVMIYRFDADGHGEVVAEAAAAHLPSFLGQHYPASDIPQQARVLYLRNWLRIIPDIRYAPADIVPTLTPGRDAPLDLSYAVLRSVSPIHIEYLINMGVLASMSISLVKDGALWGLIACHHYAPKYLAFPQRAACEFLGQAMSLMLGAKEDAEHHGYEVQVKDIGVQLVNQMAGRPRWQDGLLAGDVSLLQLVDAGGAAIVANDEVLRLGQTPEIADLRALVAWLAARPDDAVATDRLPLDFPPLAHCKDVASGVLAVPIARELGDYLLWFRPEVIQTVNWAGAPEKAVVASEDGLRLSPRKSFALWQQTVALRSLPWREVEIRAALDLRNMLRGLILQRAADLARLNAELERSNAELDAFSYIASHDLKEPLRGLHNYAHFLIEDYHDQLDADGQAKLETLMRLTQRMDALIDALLHYSQVGRVDLQLHAVDLNQVVANLRDTLAVRLANVVLRVPRPLPTVRADEVHLGLVLQNLLSNAAKYNLTEDKWIEIGYQSPDEQGAAALYPRQTIIYVRDNGLGIAAKHFETIFRIFKRLHGRDHFGGGTGVGLTIAKKIVERQGGKIWVESALGTGTTFFFTIPE
ncbi:MAG TPA: ATP-binding protein [Herpetosiphonaceae bacterium]